MQRGAGALPDIEMLLVIVEVMTVLRFFTCIIIPFSVVGLVGIPRVLRRATGSISGIAFTVHLVGTATVVTTAMDSLERRRRGGVT